MGCTWHADAKVRCNHRSQSDERRSTFRLNSRHCIGRWQENRQPKYEDRRPLDSQRRGAYLSERKDTRRRRREHRRDADASAGRGARRSEKLAAVGQLASSIAHEINNPLESITNLLYLMRHSQSMDDVQEYATNCPGRADAGYRDHRQTLRFHRQQTGHHRWIWPNCCAR